VNWSITNTLPQQMKAASQMLLLLLELRVWGIEMVRRAQPGSLLQLLLSPLLILFLFWRTKRRLSDQFMQGNVNVLKIIICLIG
jgi:hypothetical protein